MSVLTDESTSLKIYNSADNEIWYISGKGTPRPLGMSYDDYCNKPVLLNKKSTVRLVGNRRNAKMIAILHSAKARGEIKDLKVCSPQVEWTNLDSYSPEKVLLNMRRWNYPSSLGGFHTVTNDDFVVYSLSSLITDFDSSEEHADKLMTLYDMHPISKYLKFIPNVNEQACMLIVAMTLDPRWFCDLFFPNKLSKYYEYMGVNKLKALADDSANTSDSGISKFERKHFVVNAWQDATTWKKKIITPESGKENFLLDVYFKVASNFVDGKKIKAKDDLESALLATCQKFLAYLHGCWMDLLYPKPAWGESLFVPEHFFGTAEEVKRFKDTFCKK